MFQENFLYIAIVLLFLDLQKLFFHVYNQDEIRPYVFVPFFNIFHWKWSYLTESVQRHIR